MKKNLIITLICFSLNNFHAQDLNSALLFSSGETLGTARFKSMSGAFGALGGDLSAVSINPAGSTIFNSSQGTLTWRNLYYFKRGIIISSSLKTQIST